jgi:UDP-glucose 4-epimerase
MTGSLPNRTLIFGGTGFVGLNLAERLLTAGESVRLFDRAAIPAKAARLFAQLPGTLDCVLGDVTDPGAVRAAFAPGMDAVILAQAITAGPEREAREPDAILNVNLAPIVPILAAARDIGVRRIVNLSSAAVFGGNASMQPELAEHDPALPIGLYGITKLAAEAVGARLAALWQLDFVSLRLSAVFGPWERATGVRDTLSPQCQILRAFDHGEPALLPRPGSRDWIYAVDVAEAVERVLTADRLPSTLYHLSSGTVWSALDWGEALAAKNPDFVCRLTGPGEQSTIDLHSATDRSPLRTDRLAADLGWRARFDRTASLDDIMQRRAAARCLDVNVLVEAP